MKLSDMAFPLGVGRPPKLAVIVAQFASTVARAAMESPVYRCVRSAFFGGFKRGDIVPRALASGAVPQGKIQLTVT
ncbi:hypothetical protein [Rhizobium sp. B21/90]|uniref:hypothetical protein n=1 Tax=Rhizobium sp. B21/90 TaxID=2819993 RepID=UPI001C5AB61A|nr:hypothetical protein [Rhizobium sp. B21/90]QYA03874.1 hypothetical protein J5278_24140 [Rhizobium sp. B21/90]